MGNLTHNTRSRRLCKDNDQRVAIGCWYLYYGDHLQLPVQPPRNKENCASCKPSSGLLVEMVMLRLVFHSLPVSLYGLLSPGSWGDFSLWDGVCRVEKTPDAQPCGQVSQSVPRSEPRASVAILSVAKIHKNHFILKLQQSVHIF